MLAHDIYWRPLADVVVSFGQKATSEAPHPSEVAFTTDLIATHRWSAGADRLQRAAAKDPWAFRRIINGDAWPPGVPLYRPPLSFPQYIVL